MKLSILLLAAGVALEVAHSRVKSGAAGSDSNTIATIEGQLANFSELTGASLRVGFLLVAVAIWLMVRGN